MERYHDLVWDARNIEHIAGHRITPDEVEDAVYSKGSVVRRGRGENIYYVFGRSYEGRYLFVVLRDLTKGFARVITAPDMSHSERKWYAKYRRLS